MGIFKDIYDDIFNDDILFSGNYEYNKKIDKQVFDIDVENIINSYNKINLSDLEIEFYNAIYNNFNDDVFYYLMITDRDHYHNFKCKNKYEFLKTVSCFKNKNYNLFFKPAEFHGWCNDANVSYLNCLFVDIDHIEEYENYDFTKCTVDEIKQFLKDKYILDNSELPNYCVASGHGLHLYYLIDQLDFNDFTAYETKSKYLESMIYFFKSDAACANISRHLRCAFSNNVKNIDDIRTTKLYKLNDSENKDIHRLDFVLESKFIVDEYIKNNRSETAKKAVETRKKNKSNISIDDNLSTKLNKNKKVKKDNIIYDNNSCDLPYITLEKDPKWRYKNIVYDLHNYYVRRGGNIVNYRNKFAFINSIYLKRMLLNENDCIEYLKKYFTESFYDELTIIVENVYKHDYKLMRNTKIASWLDFTEIDINNSYAYYTEEKVKEQIKLNTIKQNQKKADKRGFKANKEFQIEFVKANSDMTGAQLADVLGVSLRTIRNLQKLIK